MNNNDVKVNCPHCEKQHSINLVAHGKMSIKCCEQCEIK
jgi:hypothetical protein